MSWFGPWYASWYGPWYGDGDSVVQTSDALWLSATISDNSLTADISLGSLAADVSQDSLLADVFAQSMAGHVGRMTVKPVSRANGDAEVVTFEIVIDDGHPVVEIELEALEDA